MVPCLCVEDQAKGFVLARQAVHHIPKPCSFPSFHLSFLLALSSSLLVYLRSFEVKSGHLSEHLLELLCLWVVCSDAL